MLWFFWTLPVLLQCWCLTAIVYTHWHRGKTERTESGIYLKIFEITQYLLNTLYQRSTSLWNLLYPPCVTDRLRRERVRDSVGRGRLRCFPGKNFKYFKYMYICPKFLWLNSKSGSEYDTPCSYFTGKKKSEIHWANLPYFIFILVHNTWPFWLKHTLINAH